MWRSKILKKRKQYNNEFKFRVALEACKGQKTLNELATIHGIHPNQISQWKRQFLEEGPTVFGQDKERQVKAQATEQSELYEQIGRLQLELAWLKKKLPETVAGKRALIEPGHPELSLRRQCQLVGLNRSSWYYQPASESPLNLLLMRLLDEQYTRTPFYGWPRMITYLQDCGYPVNHKRVHRLLRKMGLVAVYPKPRTTLNNPEHRVYPYRLRDLAVTQPNQVWCADITYIRLTSGFMYLVAIMDWFSRYILTWELSNTLDGHFCLSALREALCHEQPAIFNTDQSLP